MHKTKKNTTICKFPTTRKMEQVFIAEREKYEDYLLHSFVIFCIRLKKNLKTNLDSFFVFNKCCSRSSILVESMMISFSLFDKKFEITKKKARS